MILCYGDSHFRSMRIVIDSDILDVGEIVEIHAKHLCIKWRRFVVKIFMMEVIEGFFNLLDKLHTASFYLTI